MSIYQAALDYATLIIPKCADEETQMSDRAATPWGLTRMKPFPSGPQLPALTIVLDAETQTGRWLGEDGVLAPVMGKHKKSGTNRETKPKTSLDGNTDEGSDQESDTD